MKELFVILVSLITTDTDKENIFYTPKLNWSHFTPIKASPFIHYLACTSSGIFYYWNGDKTIDVYCTFNTTDSRVVEGQKTKETLNHEQRHLDLSYLYALKLVKELRDCQPQSDRDAEQVYWRINKELDEVQDDYDIEARCKQPQWDKKIDSLISLYKPYGEPLKKDLAKASK